MKSIYISNPGLAKIGDTAVCEPALYEFGKYHDSKIYFNVCFDSYHDQLFEGHPYIIPVRNMPFRITDLIAERLSSLAIRNYVRLELAFSSRPGISSEGKRLHYGYWPDLSPRDKSEDFWVSVFKDSILLVPNGHSCVSRNATSRPNVQPKFDFWKPIVNALPPGKVFALASKKDHEEFTHAQTFKDLTIRQLLIAMKCASLMISVETGPLHLVSATKTPCVFLSSATPEVFSKPDTDCKVIRAEYADQFNQDFVVQAALRLLEKKRGN